MRLSLLFSLSFLFGSAFAPAVYARQGLPSGYVTAKPDSLPPLTFFSFTPEGYRRFFPDSDYIEVEGQLLFNNLEQNPVLKLFIKVQDRDAQNSYGNIEAGPALLVQFFDGKTLLLSSNKNAKLREKEGVFYFEVNLPLDKKSQKILKNKEIDKVGLYWSGGKQTYEVYYLDFFRDLLGEN